MILLEICKNFNFFVCVQAFDSSILGVVGMEGVANKDADKFMLLPVNERHDIYLFDNLPTGELINLTKVVRNNILATL